MLVLKAHREGRRMIENGYRIMVCVERWIIEWWNKNAFNGNKIYLYENKVYSLENWERLLLCWPKEISKNKRNEWGNRKISVKTKNIKIKTNWTAKVKWRVRGCVCYSLYTVRWSNCSYRSSGRQFKHNILSGYGKGRKMWEQPPHQPYAKQLVTIVSEFSE